MSSLERSKSYKYKKESMEVLKTSFPQISVVAIRAAFLHHEYMFVPSYNSLQGIQSMSNTGEDHLHRIVSNHQFLRGVGTVVLKKKRSPNFRSKPRNEVLRNELRDIPEFCTKQGRRETDDIAPKGEHGFADAAANVAPEKNNENAAKPKNKDSRLGKSSPLKDTTNIPVAASAIPVDEERRQEATEDCECCFDDFPFDEMVACSEGNHLFCKACVDGHVKEQLYGNDCSALTCMSTDGCTGTYSSQMLEKALSPRTHQNLLQHCGRTEVQKCGIEGLWTCPPCGDMAIVDANDPSTFVECQGCQHKVCPRCKDDPHEDEPSCERAKAVKDQANAHSRIADAMTEAVVRACPGCKTSIIKSEGCNKMTCPKEGCKTMFCYICRRAVDAYSHFCQTPHCNHASCGKCVVFANTDEDDCRARRAAGKRAREELGAAAENSFALLSPERAERNEKVKVPRTVFGFFRNWFF